MDVDEDEDGTQHPKKVQDFGIEVNFESLDDEEREVRMRHAYSIQRLATDLSNRMVPQTNLPNLTQP
jgi:hypothetical protein